MLNKNKRVHIKKMYESNNEKSFNTAYLAFGALAYNSRLCVCKLPADHIIQTNASKTIPQNDFRD